jgi:HEAT repeat protein
MASKQNVHEIVFSKLKSYEDRFYQVDFSEILALGAPAIPPLINALQDRTLRRPALDLLREFGSRARNAVPLAIEILGSEDDDDTAWRAIQLLVVIGRPALGSLFDRIGFASQVEFPRVLMALRDFKVDVNPGLIKRLRDSDPRVRARCCQILSSVGHSKMHNPTHALIERLSDADETVRDAAIQALRASCPTQAILDAFKNGESTTRIACMRVLSERPGIEDLPFFVSSLADEDPFVRIHAANGLSRLAIGTSENALRKECRHESSTVRLEALRVCRRIAHHSFNVDDMAFRSLRYDDNQAVAREAIALNVERRKYRKSFCQSEWIRSAFRKSILDANDPNRCQYFYALTHADAFGRSMIPTVIECLQDPDADVVVAAIHALGEIGEGCEEVVSSLVPFLDPSRHSYNEAALYALQQIGPAASFALPRLQKLLNNVDVQNRVLLALESMGPAAEPALGDVVALIGQRIEHPPFVLASIGTREAIIELCKSKASYGRGDRKDFDASCGALALIAESARPLLEAELKSAAPEDYFWILAGLESVLDKANFHDLLMKEYVHGSTQRQLAVLKYLPQIMLYSERMLSQFVSTPGAINTLAMVLRSEDHNHRIESLELFCLIHEKWSALAEFYRDQLAKCIRLTLAAAHADYDVERADYYVRQLHTIAEKLGLPQ